MVKTHIAVTMAILMLAVSVAPTAQRKDTEPAKPATVTLTISGMT